MNGLITFAVKFVEGMFLVGIAGSLVTILVTTVDDIKVLTDTDPTPQHHE